MDNRKYKISKNILTVAIILLLPLYILIQTYSSDDKNSVNISEYVGKETCIECHKAEYNDWKGSDHDLAMDYATDSSVLGDFNNAVLIRNNQTHKAYKKDNKFFVLTDGEDDKMHEYEVKYVFGHYPLQQYLVEFPGGRLQTLALTWNSKNTNWYYMADSVYQGMSVTHNNWLHWTNQSQNWNSMCADCHSTNLQKNYNPHTNTYNTTWSEIDVSCEACHGPASKHLEWAKLADYARKEFVNYGLPIKTSGVDNHQYVDNCARCHSRRTAFGDYNPHSHSIYNNILPALPTQPNWYIDGQIKEEDYVYASFTQSRMFMNDVKCNDCHNVHSGKLVLQGNALCLQCHKSDDYDTPNHTFHKEYGEQGQSVISAAGVKFEVGSGTECINCHMHGQNFMGVDYRRDHSFRIPRPDLSKKNGTPNACNQCHKDKSNKWAADYIVEWFGQSRPYQYGEAFLNSDNKKLHSIIADDLYPPSIRGSAIGYLSNNIESNKLIKEKLQSREAAIRISAVNRLDLKSEKDLELLLPLLYDETKAVRLEVINRLANIDTNYIPKRYKTAYNKVVDEKLKVLEYNADFPIGKYNLANYYYSKKEYEKAEKYYLDAIKQDRELNIAKLNLANLYSTMEKPIKAEKILSDFVKENPENGNALYNYGLILSENKKYKLSLEYLIKASDLLPLNSRVDYNIAMLYDFFKDKNKAEEYLLKAIEKEGSNQNYSNLLNFYAQNKYFDKMNRLKTKMNTKFSDN